MNELKIEDLSIGDWVCYTGKCIDGIGPNRKITYIERDTCGFLIGLDYGVFHYSSAKIEDIIPIPITPEILEKIGFVEMWGDFVVTHNGFYINIEVQENRFGLEVSADGHIIISCDVEFVHQLQHALRLACVGKEIEV